MGDGSPPEWVATLDALGKLEFDHIIGGHGGVKPRAHLKFFRDYLADLVAAVRTARGRGETLVQATVSVSAALKPKYNAGMGGRFDGSVGDNIEKVYRDLDAKKVLNRVDTPSLCPSTPNALPGACRPPDCPRPRRAAGGPVERPPVRSSSSGPTPGTASKGIYVAPLDPATGGSRRRSWRPRSNPIFLAATRTAASSTRSARWMTSRASRPAAWPATPSTRRPAPRSRSTRSRRSAAGRAPSASPGKHGFAANYGGGSVAAYRWGRRQARAGVGVRAAQGSSVDPPAEARTRTRSPRIPRGSSSMSPTSGWIRCSSTASTPPPGRSRRRPAVRRDLAGRLRAAALRVHPRGKHAYVINEMISTSASSITTPPSGA